MAPVVKRQNEFCRRASADCLSVSRVDARVFPFGAVTRLHQTSIEGQAVGSRVAAELPLQRLCAWPLRH